MKTRYLLLVLVFCFLSTIGAFAQDTRTVPTQYSTIQDAIDAANSGDTVYILNGTYVQSGTININKSLTLDGESESGVTIDASGNGTGYGIKVEADNVTLSNFTLTPPQVDGVEGSSGGGYAIHATFDHGSPYSALSNLTIENITIDNGNRTGFDIHGYNGVTLTNLTSTDAAYGNGIQLTGCTDATVTGCTTSGNAWGGVAVYCSNSSYLNRGSDNITFDFAANSVDESFYIEDEFGLTNTNINVSNWTYGIENDYDTDANMLVYTDKDLAYALDIGESLNNKYGNEKSLVFDSAGGTQYVGEGMSIQAAIDAADPGDVVQVSDGTYTENPTINKSLTLQSENPLGATIAGNLSVYDDGDNSTIDGFNFTPTSGTAIAVWWAGNVTISNNYFDGNSGAVDGITFSHSSSPVITGGTISDNEFANCDFAINMDHDGVYDFSVTGNTIDNARKGVGFGSLCGGTIEGNTITNCSSMGVEIFKADVTTLSDNTLTGNAVSVSNGDASNTLDASPNWWGDTDPTDDVSGDVTVYPCYSDASMMTLYAPVQNTTQTLYYESIQPAIDEANAGDVIQVAAGTYDENISITKVITLTGAGIDASIIQPSSGEHAVVIGTNSTTDSYPGLVIEDFTITAAPDPEDMDGIRLNGMGSASDHIIIRGCKFTGEIEKSKGIESPSYDGVGYVTIDNCAFDNVKYGVWMNSFQNSIIQNCTVTNTKYDGFAFDTSDLTRLSNIQILNNSFDGCGTNDDLAFPEYRATLRFSDTVTELVVSGNTIENIAQDSYGIYLAERSTATPSADDIQIYDNVIYATSTEAGYVNDIDSSPEFMISPNYWGSADPDFDTVVQGAGAYCPFYSDPGLTTLDYSCAAVHNITQDTYHTTIQEGIDEANAGDTLEIYAGTHNENIDIDKQLTLIGAGSDAGGTIITQVGGSATPDSKVGVVQLSASGVSESEPILLQDIRIEPDGMAGISVGRFTEETGQSVSYIKLDNVKVIGTTNNPCTEQERGLYVDNTSTLSELVIENSEFSMLIYGWYFHKKVDSSDPSTVTDVTVTNTVFDQNVLKGIYAEKLENVTFTSCQFTDNGATTPDLSACSYFAPWKSGIDMNLKAGTYQDITFDGCTITGNGIGEAKEGVGLTVKGRDDGSTYGAHPATVDNVVVTACTITGNERGVRFGEPGKDNATPTNVVVEDSKLHSNAQNYSGADGSAYGDMINQTTDQTDASPNWWGSSTPPVASSQVYGDVVYYPCYAEEAMATLWAPVYNVTKDTWHGTIQDGIDNASSGDELQCAEYTFVENNFGWTGLRVEDKSLTIKGEGSSKTIVQVADKTNGIEFQGDIDIHLEGITFTKDGSTGPGFFIRLGETASTYGTVVFKDLVAEYATGRNVMMDQNGVYTDVLVEDCTFQNSGIWGFSVNYPTTAASGLTFRNSSFLNNGTAGNVNSIGLDIQIANNVTVENCLFDGNLAKGISLGAVNNCTFTDVTLTNNGDESLAMGDRNAVSFWEFKGTSSNIEFINPTITDNDGRGIMLGTQDPSNTITGFSVTGGYFENNTAENLLIWQSDANGLVSDVSVNKSYFIGDIYSNSPEALDLSANWWGSNDASTVRSNANGSVNDYTPWLEVGDDTDTGAAGFQPDLSYLFVDDDSPQIGSTGRIQEGVDMVSGSTVSVKAGTYNEKITIDKSVDLLGDDGAILDGTGLGDVTGVSIKSGDVTFDNFTVKNFGGNGIIVGYEATPPGDLQNVVITNNTIHNIHPGSPHGFGLYVGYEAEGFGAGTLTDHLNYDGLVISGNEIYDTEQAVLVLQSITASSGTLQVYDNDLHTSPSYSAIWIDTARKLDIYNNRLHDCANGIYISAIADGWYVADGAYGPKDIDIHDNIIEDNSSFGVVTYAGWMGDIDVNYNYFSGNAMGFQNEVAALIDATNNYWGDPSGPLDNKALDPGIPPYNNTGGLGDPVSSYVEYDPWLTGNVVWDPDPEYLTASPNNVKTVAVKYLGGGSDPLYGYDIEFSWDASLVTTDASKVLAGDIFSGVSSSFYKNLSGNTITVNAAMQGDDAGVEGPGTLFTVEFTNAGSDAGICDLVFARVNLETNAGGVGVSLTGIDSDDGQIIVDFDAPTVDVVIENTTLSFTNDYIKDGDDATVTATIVEDGELTVDDITADLSPFGGGTAVHPDPGDLTYDAGDDEWTATWDVSSVTCDPSNGTLTIEVTVEDMGGNVVTGSDDIEADNILPSQVTGLTSTCGHRLVNLEWAEPTDNNEIRGVVIRYNRWGDYPTYANPEPAYPADADDGEDAVSANPLSGSSYVHTFPEDNFTPSVEGVPGSYDHDDYRDIYYYSAFAMDMAGNVGTTVDEQSRDRSTNYFPGDVGSGYYDIPGSIGYDGYINFDDSNMFGKYYWLESPLTPPADEANFGPTLENKTYAEGHRLGIPCPTCDDKVAFEDLMVLSMNYGEVAPPKTIAQGRGRIEDHFALELRGTAVENEDDKQLIAHIYLANNGQEIKGTSVTLSFDTKCLQLIGIEQGQLFGSAEKTSIFMSRSGENWIQIDATILGTDRTIDYSGDLAVARFKVLGTKGGEISFDSYKLRDGQNQKLTAECNSMSVEEVMLPTTFDIAQNYPNPFNPETTIQYQLPEAAHVELVIFNTRGQRVATLVDEQKEAGRYNVVWHGTDATGNLVSSGTYYYRITAGDFNKLLKMLYLK